MAGTVSLRRRRDQWALLHMFFMFGLLPVTVVFGHRGLAPWLLLASFPAYFRGDFWLITFGSIFDRMDPKIPYFAGFLSIFAFCGWVAITGIWSPRDMPEYGLWVFAPVIVGGIVTWYASNVNKVWAWRIAFAFGFSIVAGMSVLLFEGLTEGFLRTYFPPQEVSRDKDIIALGRGVTALAPALFPAGIIAAAIWNRWVALALIALGGAAAIANDVSANVLALGFGLFAAIIAFRAPRKTIRGLSLLMLTALLFAPLAALAPVEAIFEAGAGKIPTSWLHRVAIWQASAAESLNGLPFGHGADYARIWNKTAGPVDVPGALVELRLIPVHPHNLYLQIWLELGLPGVLLFAGFLYWGGRALADAHLEAPVVAAAAGAIGAIFVSTMVETTLWQVWRFAAMGLAAMGVGLAYALHMNWSRVQ